MANRQRPMGGPGGRRTMGRVKPDENTWKNLRRLMDIVFEDYKFHFLAVIACIFVSALCNVRGTLFLKTLIDGYIVPLLRAETPDFTGLGGAILKMASIYGVGIVATFFQSLIMMYVTQGTLKKIRNDMFRHMQTLPIRYFDSHTHGELMSRYTNDVNTMRQMISQTIPQIVNSTVTIVSVFASMVALSWQLTIIAICVVFIMIKLSGKVGSLSGKFFRQQQADLGKLNGYIEEMMEGQKVVKVFTHEEKAKEEFEKLNENLAESMTKAHSYANIMGPINANLGHLNFSVTAIAGGLLAVNGIGGVTVGTIAAFLQLVRSFNMPISQVAQQFNTVVLALAGAGRVFDVMDQKPEVDDGKITLAKITHKNGEIVEADWDTNEWAWRVPDEDGTFHYVELKGDVQFHNVDFGYTDEKIVLHNINLYANPGQKIAFVGSTGAGKTTITNLINRFYDIQEGTITYDGINIKDIKKADLRHSLGIVLQDTHLFTGTIRENIRYGNLNASDDEIRAAALIANADSFIQNLPDGYDTELTADGGSLSQGQRQLLSIARAAVANPPVLILDEATSSIDTRTEGIIQGAMDSLMFGRTVFVIAHRLSTIRNSNAIMVLEGGNIIERGDHDELISQGGKYFQLYTGKLELD